MDQASSKLSRQRPILSKGQYDVRLAANDADIAAAQALRVRGFAIAGEDIDPYDDAYLHLLVQNRDTGALVCCARLTVLEKAADQNHSYCAQFHDFSSLLQQRGRLVELGRFCIDPEVQDADILRIAWGALTRFVDDSGASMLIGCTSFAGTNPDLYKDAFAMLAARHLAPDTWCPKITRPNAIRYSERFIHRPDPTQALQQMPPLLRSYLAMGGKVGDHLVIDPVLNTLHVFTGLEIGAIPENRKRRLRALAQ